MSQEPYRLRNAARKLDLDFWGCFGRKTLLMVDLYKALDGRF